MTDEPVSWENAHRLLLKWHEDSDPEVGRAVFYFLEVELRLMIPSLVRRSWPEDLVEDTLRSFLSRLVERPLATEISSLRAYLRRSFGNYCIDCHRAQARRREIPLEIHSNEWDQVVEYTRSRIVDEAHTNLSLAMASLSIKNRVVLKLELAPEWLSDEEIDWLASRTNSNSACILDAIRCADDMHALTRIFDPGDDSPDDPKLRRDRMERFRRRRSRARDILRQMLKEVMP